MSVNLSFGLEYECEYYSDKDIIVKEFDNLMGKELIKEYSLHTHETTFRLFPNKTEAVEEVMKIFNAHYNFNDSTTHIHADATTSFPFFNLDNVSFEERQQVIDGLFQLTNYEVIKNKPFIAKNSKYNMVNIRSCFKTIEYRCFPVTFNAELLLFQLKELYKIHTFLIDKLCNKRYISAFEYKKDIITRRKIIVE